MGCRFRPGSFVGQVSGHIKAKEGQMAKYLILIYGQESSAPATPDQWDQMMQAHGRFAQAVDQQGGKILGGEALQPTATATSIRSDGQAVTSGPFVATKEALGGFYLIEAADPEQALALAKQCPAPGGGVELRPIMDTSGGPPSA
jgi:hypothetical protein